MYYARPRFIQRLVPDAAREHLNIEVLTPGENESAALVVDAFAVLVLDQIHLVHETENKCGLAKLFQCLDDRAIGVEVALDFARLNIEDIDKDGDVGEYRLTLGGEVGLREGILSAAELELSSPWRSLSWDMLARHSPIDSR